MAVEQRISAPELREWRERIGWPRHRLALHLGYSHGSVVLRWEDGTRRIPSHVATFVEDHLVPAPTTVVTDPSAALRAAIQAAGLSPSRWAAWWGSHYHAVCRWLNGSEPVPSDIQAWLRAGAPSDWPWRRTFAGRAAPVIPALPRVALRLPGGDMRAQREARGWTQAELAARLGVHPRTVWEWECRRGAPGWVETWWAKQPATTEAPPPRPATGPGVRSQAEWVRVEGLGYAPPAGYCDPERDALRLEGCAWCGYRPDCLAEYGQEMGA